MRDLLSLRRDEAPIIGEVYRYRGVFLKCVADRSTPFKACKKCFFFARRCSAPCEVENSLTYRHFEQVPESEIEAAAEVKFRHIEETRNERPKKDEKFIASVGLVVLIDLAGIPQYKGCTLCDLTMSECDSCSCPPNHCYKKYPQ